MSEIKSFPLLTPSGKPWPKISIVTPSCNQGQFLEETICSILGQGYPNLEYIIIDGGSTDNSVKIIKKYEQSLAYWVSEKDAGQYDAINKGFARSTGEVMAWLNSDDMYLPWTLRTVAEIFDRLQQVDWLTTMNPGTVDYFGNCLGFLNVQGYSKDAFLDGAYLPFRRKGFCWIQQESTFWRRSLWKKAGGKIAESIHLAADFDLWCRFYRYSELYGVASPFSCFRLQDQQKSLKIEEYVKEAELSLSDMRQYFSWKPNFLRRLVVLTQLYRFPVLRNIFKKNYFYHGKKIRRVNPRSQSGEWKIENDLFFYR